LQRSFRSPFYERLSSFCCGKIREIYLSRFPKVIFLLVLCAEVNFSLGLPVSRNACINFPYATTLNITEHILKLFSLEKTFSISNGKCANLMTARKFGEEVS
jgi:hypothetical protein